MLDQETVNGRTNSTPEKLSDEPCEWCDGPDNKPVRGVARSAAGYYIGYTYECCGAPFSRESGYYATEAEAEANLLVGEGWERT